MIEVRIDMDSMTIACKGHADMMQENGIDAVCAGVSTIIYTLLWSITEDVKLHLVEGVESRMEKGDAQIHIIPHREYVARAMHKFQMACDGMQMLEQRYPQAIRVIV